MRRLVTDHTDHLWRVSLHVGNAGLHLGQCDRAVAHYHRCRQVLKTELGVEPAPETQRLYRELVVTGRLSTAAAQARR